MTRRCSHCSHNGHNSRTCPNRGVKLFGVRLAIDHGSIRKSASMGNLTAQHMTGGAGNGCGSTAHQNGVVHDDYPSSAAAGYASEDFVAGSSSSNPERRKGVPWTEEEHRMFLLGLQKLGKGDWRGISRNYVITRTPTQVASHAQKYFIRQTNVSRRKRRSSLFDLVPRQSVDPPLLSKDIFSVNPQEVEKQSSPDSAMDEESESTESANPRFPCVHPAAYVAQIFSLPVPF